MQRSDNGISVWVNFFRLINSLLKKTREKEKEKPRNKKKKKIKCVLEFQDAFLLQIVTFVVDDRGLLLVIDFSDPMIFFFFESCLVQLPPRVTCNIKKCANTTALHQNIFANGKDLH